jgi:GT2 family glycosyltransferase
MIKILVGIPVLDNIEMTRACLQSLYQYTDSNRVDLEVSVLIVDNGSKDDIASMIKDDFSEAGFPTYYVRNQGNLGVAIAWNQILRFTPGTIEDPSFCYDYYVISNNDIIFGPDWLQPLVEAMEGDKGIGWVAALENGSPVMKELLEVHSNTKRYRIDPNTPYCSENIQESVKRVYEKWGGHGPFCKMVKESGLPLFIGRMRSAVCFMVRPVMVRELGFFDEDFPPVGISEDLEYFLRIEGAIKPSCVPNDYPVKGKWKYGLCGRSVIHHNWCMTRQGPSFDGRGWDKEKEKNWRTKFGRSKKYYIKKFLA